MTEFVNKLRSNKIFPKVVAVGSTPSCAVAPSYPGATEMHPGNYIFFDRMQVGIGACSRDEISASVLARVISHYPERNTIMVDAGGLALSKEECALPGYGELLEDGDLVVTKASQEHGLITSASGKPVDFSQFPLGSTVRILPNHSCLAAACFSHYYVVKDDNLVAEWKPTREW